MASIGSFPVQYQNTLFILIGIYILLLALKRLTGKKNNRLSSIISSGTFLILLIIGIFIVSVYVYSLLSHK